MTNAIQSAIFNDQSCIQKFASYFKGQDTIQNAVFVIKNAVLNSIVSKKSILNGF